MSFPAIFLDRDGVLIEDVHLLIRPEQIRILPNVAKALSEFKKVGFKLIVVSNQTVVARGLASEADVHRINSDIEKLLQSEGAPAFTAIYICPHHPKATLPEYRMNCECRKPRAGMFLQAAREHDIDLKKSFTIGDRITDIIAGVRAGCRTVLVQSGKHTDVPIETVEPIDQSIHPDHTCADLLAAAKWISANK